ncbi:hypothetical protein K439DRAFT_1418984 [Ramaria rubella]|nr:hypothetical protein K439DRAFT_1418984 [Ramaria rubella]
MEMEDLSTAAKRRKRDSPRQGLASSGESEAFSYSVVQDNTISIWAYVTAIWLVVMSIPFLAFPRFLLFLSSTASQREEHREYLTPLESFLSTHFAILALSAAVGIVVSIPPDSPVAPRIGSGGHPLLVPVTCGLLISAFLSYNTPASQVGPLAFFVALGAGVTSIWGVFALLFSGSSISPRTEADKRTSRFLFKKPFAASTQKKQLTSDGA